MLAGVYHHTKLIFDQFWNSRGIKSHSSVLRSQVSPPPYPTHPTKYGEWILSVLWKHKFYSILYIHFWIYFILVWCFTIASIFSGLATAPLIMLSFPGSGMCTSGIVLNATLCKVILLNYSLFSNSLITWRTNSAVASLQLLSLASLTGLINLFYSPLFITRINIIILPLLASSVTHLLVPQPSSLGASLKILT